MRKKILAAILTASMVLSLTPVFPVDTATVASAEDEAASNEWIATFSIPEEADLYLTFTNEASYQEITSVTGTEAVAGSVADNKEVSGDVIDYVGTPDLSSAFFTQFSKHYLIAPDCDATFTLRNYGNGAAVWNNYVMAFTNEPGINNFDKTDANIEYAIIRADAFAWGESTVDFPNGNGIVIESDFLELMKAANVTINVKRSGGTINISAKATAIQGSGNEDPGNEDPGNETPAKKTMKISKITAKKNATTVTGTVSVKKATVKVKVGNKAYKKATVNGKKFTIKVAKLKKGTKVTVKATKSGYKADTKSVTVK